MAATPSKTSYKWCILHRNHLVSLYLLLIYLSITLIVLHDFSPVFYFIPTILVIGLIRVTWEQSSYALSALTIFVIGLVVASCLTSSLQTRQQRSLQLLYNYEQFKNISSLNPTISPQNTFPPVSNIFFIETNLNRGKLGFHSRLTLGGTLNCYIEEEFSSKQMCAIESAAKNNRNSHVYVLSIRAQLDRQLQPLTDLYPNIILMKFMPIELFRDTPLMTWWQTGRVFKSKYMLAHISDAARLALLWKYGGVYSDLDTITIKSFQSLLDKSGVGYIFENKDGVGNGVMIFRQNHPFLMRAMEAFVAGYDPYVWGDNGPTTILKTIKSYCHVDHIDVIIKNSSLCDLVVFPEEYFYPLRYIDREFQVLFQHDVSVDMRKLTKSYSVHYYGFMSKDMKVNPRDNTLFGFLASCNCQLTFSSLELSGKILE